MTIPCVTFLRFNEKSSNSIIPRYAIGKLLSSKSAVVFPVVSDVMDIAINENIIESFSDDNSTLVEFSFSNEKNIRSFDSYYKLIKDSYFKNFNNENTVASIIFYATLSLDDFIDELCGEEGRYRKIILVSFIVLTLGLNGFSVDNLFYDRINDIDFNNNQSYLSDLLKDYTFNRKACDS